MKLNKIKVLILKKDELVNDTFRINERCLLCWLCRF